MNYSLFKRSFLLFEYNLLKETFLSEIREKKSIQKYFIIIFQLDIETGLANVPLLKYQYFLRIFFLANFVETIPKGSFTIANVVEPKPKDPFTIANVVETNHKSSFKIANIVENYKKNVP